MLTRARMMLGMGEEGEVRTLQEWMEEQRTGNQDNHFDVRLDEHGVCCGLFFMSADMKASFLRNGQFVVIDSTCKTNRFGMQLVLLVGSNEILRTVIFAIGLLLTESGDAYTWLLQQVKKAVGQ
jgi:hypothetical protein